MKGNDTQSDKEIMCQTWKKNDDKGVTGWALMILTAFIWWEYATRKLCGGTSYYWLHT